MSSLHISCSFNASIGSRISASYRITFRASLINSTITYFNNKCSRLHRSLWVHMTIPECVHFSLPTLVYSCLVLFTSNQMLRGSVRISCSGIRRWEDENDARTVRKKEASQHGSTKLRETLPWLRAHISEAS